MRFVARLSIAIATLLTSAVLCWGQQPAKLQPVASPASQVKPASYPSPSPPEGDTGVWIDDSMGADEMASPIQPPEQLGVDPFSLDQSMVGAEGCNCPECAGVGAGGGHGWLAPLWCSDMWNEVHAHRRIYAQVDYMQLWTKGNLLPPLVTTSPLGTPQTQAGVLPVSATTEVLFGNGRVDQDAWSGGRVNLGYWLVDGEFLGVEGQYFALGNTGSTFDMTSNFTSNPDAMILARPFTNYNPSLPNPTNDAAIVAFPDGYQLGPGQGTLNGRVRVQTDNNLQSAGALLRKLVWIDFTMQRRLDLLLGYRFLRLDDSVTIQDASVYVPTSGPIPEVLFASEDIFGASNVFNGGEIGLKGLSQHGRFGLEFVTKVAFGNNRQTMKISGQSVQASGGVPVEYEGGLLAQASNIGTRQRDVFAILPEANLNLRYDVTCNLRAVVGYNFLYLNRVQRSGDAISTALNPTQINGGTLVGDPYPAFAAQDDTWWAHGFTVGAEYRW